MISASSSSTLRAARKLIPEPLACFEHRRAWGTTSLGHQQQRSYNTERPNSEKPRRQPPQPIPTATQLKPRFSSNSQVKANPPEDGSERPKRLLEPYVLSQRLTKLALQGQLDEAVVMLQNSPLDASNVITWNTLLLHCMTAGRFKLGYKLFTDMKRRGFRPNVRTYHVLLSGLSRIQDWEEHSVQFKNAQAIWRGFLHHIKYLKTFGPRHKEIRANPAAFYISILAANKQYNAMFDVLNALDKEGPFSPTEFIYSKVFQAIACRTQLTPGDEENVAYRNASDAKLVWKDLTKRAVNDPELVSGPVIMYFIKTLVKGRPGDQLYGFDVIHDYLGLSKPGEEAPLSKIQVAPMALDSALQLCLHTHKHRLCIHYVQQIIDDAIANDQTPILDYGHMEKVLRAYAAMTMAGSVGESNRAVETIEWMHQYHALGWNVRPRVDTYGWGLMSCWRGGDWASAARIAELMTGCHAETFVDGSKTSSPSPSPSSQRLNSRKGQVAAPDVRSMSCLLRAALASDDVANMRQCLRMLTFFGEVRSPSGIKYMDAYLSQENPFKEPWPSQFYSAKVASTLTVVLTRVLEGTDSAVDTPEVKVWRGLRARVKEILRKTGKLPIKTPESEFEPLGSAGDLQATEQFVDYDLATRSQKPGRNARW